MVPKHPCPTCGALRTSPSAACDACEYPKHEPYELPDASRKIKPLQFDLRTLLACLTASAITFAVLQSRGDDRFEAALVLGGILYPIVNFFLQFRRNLAAQRQRDRVATPHD